MEALFAEGGGPQELHSGWGSLTGPPVVFYCQCPYQSGFPLMWRWGGVILFRHCVYVRLSRGGATLLCALPPAPLRVSAPSGGGGVKTDAYPIDVRINCRHWWGGRLPSEIFFPRHHPSHITLGHSAIRMAAATV